MKPHRPRIQGFAVAALVAAFLLSAPPASGREVSGESAFAEEVVVPKGEVWKVLPGTVIRFRGGKWTVRGRLVVEGTPERPVRISGDDAFEGLDIRGGDGSVIAGAVITGGRRGVQVVNAAVTFRSVTWERNGIGLDVGQYARVKVSGCTFSSPGRVGILVRRGGSAEVAGTRVERAGKAGIFVYGATDVSVRECRFLKNAAGVHAAMSGARVTVEKCVFLENGTALLAEKTAVPKVSGCEIAGNREGFRFSRRAEGEATGNTIAGNEDGVVVEYSSYPVFRGNRFRGNRGYAVRLRHQSAQWEEELGDTDREDTGRSGGAPFGKQPAGRGDFLPGGRGGDPGPPGRKASLPGTVDFRGNDWGGAVVPKDGNAPFIHDGRDEPTFEYRGKRYAMDRVLLD